MSPVNPSTIKRGKTPRAFIVIEMLTGLTYTTLFTIWSAMAVLFAAAYFGLSYVGGGIEHAPTSLANIADPLLRFANALYYSIITATSTGYGDITPVGFSKVLASMQSISALLVFAIFVTKLVSHQQEMTLTEVHRLTFEDVFHNTREGMYIARKDFDHIIREAEKHNALDAEHWENMIIAFQQLQTLFEEIPDFYENEIHHYTIDEKREQLLLEAVHRTLHRVNQMFDSLGAHDIDWFSHADVMKEVEELVHIVTNITPLWKERSPYEAHEAFEDILQMKERMHLKLLKSIQ
ncbi:hypothetical protein CL635_01150 [bacterium]|nr:hypothetical protein [bacterium]|tara:strand:+ start:4046 stop:4924 length:879 start_codon:yes stop_codon:yes gene_type:complete